MWWRWWRYYRPEHACHSSDASANCLAEHRPIEGHAGTIGKVNVVVHKRYNMHRIWSVGRYAGNFWHCRSDADDIRAVELHVDLYRRWWKYRANCFIDGANSSSEIVVSECKKSRYCAGKYSYGC